jgi:hypothetical protein
MYGCSEFIIGIIDIVITVIGIYMAVDWLTRYQNVRRNV